MTVSTDTLTTVARSVEVRCSPEQAYALFTAGIQQWWHPDHHLLDEPVAHLSVEPTVGGLLTEEGVSGARCSWGRVLTWDPPRVFAFAWLIGPDWAPPAPEAAGSTVTVTFTPTATGTRVDLVHSGLDAHGPGWEAERDAIAGPRGWSGLLDRFATTAAA